MEWRSLRLSDFSRDEYERGFTLMSAEKKKRTLALRNAEDQKRTVAGELLARRMISHRSGISEEALIFEAGPYGKPACPNGGVEFNISHSGEMVVCCVSDSPVGIDVERIRPISPHIVRRVCTASDLAFILGCGCETVPDRFDREQLCRFFEVWTAKEAYFKCLGTGIGCLKKISIAKLAGRKSVQTAEYSITVFSRRLEKSGSPCPD